MTDALIVLGFVVAIVCAALALGALIVELHPAHARRLANKIFRL
jgi:hypothetical protein